MALHHRFQVPDLFLPSATLMFLLESPHVQELKHGVPVAGTSGGTMSKHLFGEAYGRFPLGLLVQKNVTEHKDRPSLNRIGLVNVCNIPMQAAAYGTSNWVDEQEQLVRALEHVRSDNQRTTYRQPLHNDVQSLLVEHLRAKLLQSVDVPLTWVPCGRFAQKFFRLADVRSPQWQVIADVPHPSYNSWDRPQYQAVVRAVVSALRHAVAE